MNHYPILYTFRRCPYAIRARMALVYSGIHFEIREIELKNKPAEMLSISPKGTVPVLQLSDGTVLEESLDIMRWSLKQADPEQWWPEQTSAQETILSLIDENDGPFKTALDGYKYPQSHPEKTAIEWQQQEYRFLEKLEASLQASQYLTGQTTSLADVALFPFVRQFSKVDQKWFEQLPLPSVQSWLNHFLESDLFNSVMKKYQAWQTGDKPTFFNT